MKNERWRLQSNKLLAKSTRSLTKCNRPNRSRSTRRRFLSASSQRRFCLFLVCSSQVLHVWFRRHISGSGRTIHDEQWANRDLSLRFDHLSIFISFVRVFLFIWRVFCCCLFRSRCVHCYRAFATPAQNVHLRRRSMRIWSPVRWLTVRWRNRRHLSDHSSLWMCACKACTNTTATTLQMCAWTSEGVVDSARTQTSQREKFEPRQATTSTWIRDRWRVTAHEQNSGVLFANSSFLDSSAVAAHEQNKKQQQKNINRLSFWPFASFQWTINDTT